MSNYLNRCHRECKCGESGVFEFWKLFEGVKKITEDPTMVHTETRTSTTTSLQQSSHELHAHSYITKEEIITSNDTEKSITQHVVLQEEPITVHTETTTSRTPSPQQSPHTLHEYSFITKKQYDR
ncbi:hypothetical protein ILUMI_14640 [Ignelater luminosus]|uniref:Uncharacterized protein n=1 Tax=Ignelater luminosus TaxID=2038154 RepID=A0A8K0CQ29_IGNLU|nr:hypothetical protein ILUMI_14640 [Ignelater luminosus]